MPEGGSEGGRCHAPGGERSTMLQKETTQVRVPTALHRVLKIYAAQKHRTMSAILGQILRVFFEENPVVDNPRFKDAENERI